MRCVLNEIGFWCKFDRQRGSRVLPTISAGVSPKTLNMTASSLIRFPETLSATSLDKSTSTWGVIPFDRLARLPPRLSLAPISLGVVCRLRPRRFVGGP